MTDKATTGLAGEYYVLAQLAHRGLVGTLTLGTTKSVDILVSDPDVTKLTKLEVKTSQRGLVRAKLFGSEPFFHWPMSLKHETMIDPSLFFCFVALGDAKERPRFFVVPSIDVATYVRDQHQFWLDSRQSAVKDTPMRAFRIRHDDPDHYEDNWDVFRSDAGV